MTLHRGFKKSDFTAPAKVFNIKMHPHAKLAYLYLLQMLDVEGEVFPGYATIARHLCISRNGARNAISELVELGLVEKINRKKKDNPKENDSNEYIVYHPDQIEGLELVEDAVIPAKSATRGMPPHGIGGMPQDGIGHDVAQGVCHDMAQGMPQDGTGGMPPHGTYSVVGVVDVVVGNDDDAPLLLESIRKKAKECFPKYRMMSLNQTEKIWNEASKHGFSPEMVFAQIEAIAQNMKIKKSVFATLYKCFSEGGWNFDEAEVQNGKPKPSKPQEEKKEEVPSTYLALREMFIAAGGEDVKKSEHIQKFQAMMKHLTVAELFQIAEKYLKHVASGEGPHKTPQIVWFMDSGWQNYQEKPEPPKQPKKEKKPQPGEKLPRAVAKQVNEGKPVVTKSPEQLAEDQRRINEKLRLMNERLSQRKQKEEEEREQRYAAGSY